jgi:acetolactate synthase regulatory subunit
MNQYTFDLIAQHRPEVLERVLRVIRLRGFTVTNMDMILVDTQVQLFLRRLTEIPLKKVDLLMTLV